VTNVVGIWEAMSHHEPRPTVSVVIPALNEERNLPHIAARIPFDIDEILFVNGDSHDNTEELARQLWPNGVHVRQTRRGKGNALACGFAAASGDIIVMIDADGSTDPAEIPRFVGALVSGADFAKGSRFVQGGGSADITTIRRLGNKGLNVLVNMLFGTKYTDLCYGYNAFWSKCLDVISLSGYPVGRAGVGRRVRDRGDGERPGRGERSEDRRGLQLRVKSHSRRQQSQRILWTIMRELRRSRGARGSSVVRSAETVGAADANVVRPSRWAQRSERMAGRRRSPRASGDETSL
jgi:hypothetical protein